MARNAYAPNTVPVGTYADGLRYFAHEAKLDWKAPKEASGNYPQKTIDGVPVWTITAMADGKFLKIAVPSKIEPALASLTPISFKNLVCGAVEGNLWFRADDVNLAE